MNKKIKKEIGREEAEIVSIVMNYRMRLEDTLAKMEEVRASHYAHAYRLMGVGSALLWAPELDPDRKVREIMDLLRKESVDIEKVTKEVQYLESQVLQMEHLASQIV
ncbi:MAG TPA: hypothetical protein VJJ22_05335 [Candidatus Paceibacterota bacterium]